MGIRWYFRSTQDTLDAAVQDADRAKPIPFLAGIVIVALWLTFTLALGIVIRFATVFAEPLEPLAPYEAIMPGRSNAFLGMYNCRSMTIPTVEMQHCEIEDPDPMFRRVTIISSNGTITHAIFSPHDLPLGYLLLWWGQPDAVEIYNRAYIATWGSHMYAVAPSLTPSSPVLTVFLSYEP